MYPRAGPHPRTVCYAGPVSWVSNYKHWLWDGRRRRDRCGDIISGDPARSRLKVKPSVFPVPVPRGSVRAVRGADAACRAHTQQTAVPRSTAGGEPTVPYYYTVVRIGTAPPCHRAVHTPTPRQSVRFQRAYSPMGRSRPGRSAALSTIEPCSTWLRAPLPSRRPSRASARVKAGQRAS